MESKVFLQCPRCGTENSRASQRCLHCGYELHTRQEVIGVCQSCRAPVRVSQITCFACGRHLDLNVEPDRVLLSPRERKRLRKEAALTTQSFRLFGASIRNGPAWFRAVGSLCLVGSGIRVYLAGVGLREATQAERAVFFTGEMIVWLAVAASGLVLLLLSNLMEPED